MNNESNGSVNDEKAAALVAALAPFDGFWESVESVQKVLRRPYGRHEQISVPSLTYDECTAIRLALAALTEPATKPALDSESTVSTANDNKDRK